MSLLWIGIAIALLMWTIGGALLWYAIDRPVAVMGGDEGRGASARRALAPAALAASVMAGSSRSLSK